MTDRTKLHGFDELQRKLAHPSWAAGPAGDFLDKWRFSVEAGAKKNSPVWRGHGRRSLTSERDQSFFPLWARAGTNLDYMRWQEFGTGLLSEDPESSKRRHWPPASALEPWARAHGTTGFAVARAIGLRGGLKPKRFLRDAADEAEQKIPSWLAQAARSMETEAGRAV